MLTGTSSGPTKLTIYNQKDDCRFLHLRDETITAAKQTVRLFARALGTKKSAFVIDACYAEMFESCSRMCKNHDVAFVNDGLDRRLHWSGLCVFANEVSVFLRFEACHVLLCFVLIGFVNVLNFFY